MGPLLRCPLALAVDVLKRLRLIVLVERMRNPLAISAIGIDARQGRDPVLRGSVRSTRVRPRKGDRPAQETHSERFVSEWRWKGWRLWLLCCLRTNVRCETHARSRKFGRNGATMANWAASPYSEPGSDAALIGMASEDLRHEA